MISSSPRGLNLAVLRSTVRVGLMIFVGFLTLAFRLGAQCDDRLREILPSSFSRSPSSIQFWKDIKSEPPPSFKELTERFKPTFINGLPTFESRPEHFGITDWVTAFARSHPLDEQLIKEAKHQLMRSRREFREQQELIEATQGQGMETVSLELAFRSQYYSELKSALSGDFLPFPGQGSEAIDEFFERRGKGGYFDLYEAHTRLYHHESDLIRLLQQKEPDLDELSRTREALHFYQRMIARLPPLSMFRGRSLR